MNFGFDDLENCLPRDQTIKAYISPQRYFEVGFPLGKMKKQQKKTMEDIKRCIASAVSAMPHWGEKVPLQWSYFEKIIHERKVEKIMSIEELQSDESMEMEMDKKDMQDMLAFYHEIGYILYFRRSGLRDHIILDVQWFVDAFKDIIVDPFHAYQFCKSRIDWENFNNTGWIPKSAIFEFWKKKENEFFKHKENILSYMENLGILAMVKENQSIYIPCINKTDFAAKHKNIIEYGNKTQVFIFYFKSYLPHFFYYRLVVKCFSKWLPLRNDLICKNVAFYKEQNGDSYIAVAVSRTSIQLQVFTPDHTIKLEPESVRKIRKQLESLIMDLTRFDEHLGIEKGYTCKRIELTDEDEQLFLKEEDIVKLQMNESPCPLHVMPHETHTIVRNDILSLWYTNDL